MHPDAGRTTKSIPHKNTQCQARSPLPSNRISAGHATTRVPAVYTTKNRKVKFILVTIATGFFATLYPNKMKANTQNADMFHYSGIRNFWRYTLPSSGAKRYRIRHLENSIDSSHVKLRTRHLPPFVSSQRHPPFPQPFISQATSQARHLLFQTGHSSFHPLKTCNYASG